MEWELVRGDVESLDRNKIIRSHCPVSSLNEALLRGIRDRVPKQTIVVRTEDKPEFDNPYVLVHSAEQRSYRIWNRSRSQADWEEYGVSRRHALYVNVEAE